MAYLVQNAVIINEITLTKKQRCITILVDRQMPLTHLPETDYLKMLANTDHQTYKTFYMKKFFCCKEMELFLNDPRDPIEYNPVFREHFIRLNNNSNIITLAYCPWCGDKLPTSLRENYFDILEKEHGIETNLGEYKERSDIPANFRTDR